MKKLDKCIGIAMDELNYVKAAYQYYIGFIITIGTFLTVTYHTPTQTIITVLTLYLLARTLGRWHYRSKNSGFSRQQTLVSMYSPQWQTTFKVLYILAEDHPEAQELLEKYL